MFKWLKVFLISLNAFGTSYYLISIKFECTYAIARKKNKVCTSKYSLLKKTIGLQWRFVLEQQGNYTEGSIKRTKACSKATQKCTCRLWQGNIELFPT